MKKSITIQQINPEDASLIKTIANWYWTEWQVPKEQTMLRLANQHPNDLHFHLMLFADAEPAATGGLYAQVGLLKSQPVYERYGPWVGLVYTATEHRQKGYGAELLLEIERRAANLGLNDLYLYTHTAESLYRKNGWATFEHATYRGHTVAVMKKSIQR